MARSKIYILAYCKSSRAHMPISVFLFTYILSYLATVLSWRLWSILENQRRYYHLSLGPAFHLSFLLSYFFSANISYGVAMKSFFSIMFLTYGSIAGKITILQTGQRKIILLLSAFCMLLHISNILLQYVQLSFFVEVSLQKLRNIFLNYFKKFGLVSIPKFLFPRSDLYFISNV